MASNSNGLAPRLRVVYYREDDTGDWRWTAFDKRNGRRVGASSEGYRRRKSVEHNATMLLGGGYRLEFEVSDTKPEKKRKRRIFGRKQKQAAPES